MIIMSTDQRIESEGADFRVARSAALILSHG